MAAGPRAAIVDTGQGGGGMRRLAVAGLTLIAVAAAAVPRASPDSPPGARLVFGPCADSATGRCGTLRVPENPAGSGGRRIGIRVLVLPALDPARRDGRTALFYLAGGPGAAASGSAGWASDAFAEYWQRHDLVFVDQRGTGFSHRLACPEARSLDLSSPPAAVRAAWGACVRRVDADPRFYTTSIAMDDLDAVRTALGYERVDLYGISYGATAAQIYLRRHGGRVRSVILDGGTLLHIPILERWAPNGQRALDRLLARCGRDAGCRGAFPDPAGDLARALAALRQAPVRVKGGTITSTLLAEAVQSATVNPERAVYVPLFLRLAAEGRWGEILRRSALLGGEDGSPDESLMGEVIMCSEPWARMRRSEVERLGRGTFLLERMIEWSRYTDAVCSVVPRGVVPAGSGVTPRSRVPVLAIVGSEDPQDPIANLHGIRSRHRTRRRSSSPAAATALRAWAVSRDG